MSVSASQLVEEARFSVPEVLAEDVNHGLASGQIDLLLDVREPAEWERGHVKAAAHIPRGLLEWLADSTFKNHEPRLAGRMDARIVVMCATGGRSLLAAKRLQEMGYRNVSSLAGGIGAWTAAGLAIDATAQAAGE